VDVGRPKWTPETDEQRRAIAAAKRAEQRATAAMRDVERPMWDAVQTALDLGVPAAFMAETVNRGRATLYLHTDPPGKAQAIETDEEN